MSFQPILTGGGLAGWRFLTRSLPDQTAVFAGQPQLQRDIQYFHDRIAKIETPAQLVGDYRLLGVALGAFGLSDDITSRAFIERLLQEGATSPEALANKLSDSRYKALAAAFGFDQPVSRVAESGFAAELTDRYQAQSFEIAVGAQNDDMRIALYAQRQFSEVVSAPGTEDAKWYRIMGEAPLRRVIEAALGLPASFGQIDLDQQLGVFKTRFAAQFSQDGLAALADTGLRDQLIDRYLLTQQAAAVRQVSAGAVALTLLQASARG